MRWEGIQQINLAQDRHKWHAVVNMVMNTCVPKNVENFLTENYWLVKKESVAWSPLVHHFDFILVI